MCRKQKAPEAQMKCMAFCVAAQAIEHHFHGSTQRWNLNRWWKEVQTSHTYLAPDLFSLQKVYNSSFENQSRSMTSFFD